MGSQEMGSNLDYDIIAFDSFYLFVPVFFYLHYCVEWVRDPGMP